MQNGEKIVVSGFSHAVNEWLKEKIARSSQQEVQLYAPDDRHFLSAKRLVDAAQLVKANIKITAKPDWANTALLIVAAPSEEILGDDEANDQGEISQACIEQIKWLQLVLNKAMAASFSGLVLVVGEDDELLVYSALRFSGLPQSNVFGLGTLPLSMAAKSLLTKNSVVSPKDVNLAVFGTQKQHFIPWGRVAIGAVPLLYFIAQKNKLFTQETMAAVNEQLAKTYREHKLLWQTKAIKFITQTLTSQSARLMPLMHAAKLGDENIAYANPVLLTQTGVAELIEPNLAEEEKQQQLTGMVQVKAKIDQLKTTING